MAPLPPSALAGYAFIMLAFLCALSVFVHAEAADSTPVEIPGPLGPLRGTLVSAGKPVVVIIPGSGPTDRDGNNPMGIKASTYRLLGEALAEQGVSSLRIDKRGMFGSHSAVKDANDIKISDYAADARSWAREAAQRTGAPCAWLLGHSEGALVAEVAAQGDTTGLCGLVLVSGPGRRLSDVLREQLTSNPANKPLLPQALAAISELEAGRHVDDTALPAPLKPLFYAAVQGFLIDMFRYDPVELLRACPLPILVVQGTTDIQVGMSDAERAISARPGIQLARLEGVNHVLKLAPADRAANIATYADPNLPLAPGIASSIASFLTAKAASP